MENELLNQKCAEISDLLISQKAHDLNARLTSIDPIEILAITGRVMHLLYSNSKISRVRTFTGNSLLVKLMLDRQDYPVEITTIKLKNK